MSVSPGPLFAAKPRAYKAKDLPPPKELATHIAVADFLRLNIRHDWDWHHVPNGEHRDKRTAAKLKAMGLMPGRADFEFCDPNGKLLCLELKRPGEEQNPAQLAWQARCEAKGVPYYVAYTFEQAVSIFVQWDCLRCPVVRAP